MKVFYSVSPLDDLSAREVHAMMMLRVSVFVAEQQAPVCEIDAHDADPQTMHVRAMAAADRSLVGTARIFAQPLTDFINELPHDLPLDYPLVRDTDDCLAWHFGRLCTAQHARGTGLGADIIAQALAWADNRDGSLPVVLTAQAPLRSYYENFGFICCGPEFTSHGVAHVPMLRPARLEQHAH